MDDKIKQLTDKVYTEGVERARTEGERIIAEAQERAASIVREAEARATELRQSAEQSNIRHREQTESELKLYAQRLVESTRASIEDSLTGTIATDAVRALQLDGDLLRQLVLKIVGGFSVERGVVIETAEAEALQAHLSSAAKGLLEAGLEIKSVAGVPTHYVVRPKDGAYKVEIKPETFVELFKSVLRPTLASLL